MQNSNANLQKAQLGEMHPVSRRVGVNMIRQSVLNCTNTLVSIYIKSITTQMISDTQRQTT